MLKLLLDEPISPDVADGLRQRHKLVPVTNMVEWEGGQFLGVPDGPIPEAAAAQELTFVTYDRSTIPPLLKSWAEAGREHGAVIFVDEKTIAPSDIGGLVRALHALAPNPAKPAGPMPCGFCAAPESSMAFGREPAGNAPADRACWGIRDAE